MTSTTRVYLTQYLLGVCERPPAAPNPAIRGVGAPMDGLSALPWTARWCQGTLPCPQSVDKRCRRSHGRVERLAMDGPLVSRYLTLPQSVDKRCRRSHGRVERLAMDGPLVSRYLTLPCRPPTLHP